MKVGNLGGELGFLLSSQGRGMLDFVERHIGLVAGG
jgi:hypothetical protein